MSKILKDAKVLESGRIELDNQSAVKDLIANTEDGLYGSVSESGEEVAVYLSKNVGMDVHFYQKNGWIRCDTYNREGFKTDESFVGRYNRN